MACGMYVKDECHDCLGCDKEPVAEERSSKKEEAAPSASNNKPSVVICQNIVEDMLNHLVREGLLTRSQCMSVRDTFVGIVVGKLTHVG